MITGLDHLVLTVASVEASVGFYAGVLGGRKLDEPGRPTAIIFGDQNLNLHPLENSFQPRAARPTSGAGDFCLLTDRGSDELLAALETLGVRVELGPVPRIGARGPMTSVYLRDPDGNLVEIASYRAASS